MLCYEPPLCNAYVSAFELKRGSACTASADSTAKIWSLKEEYASECVATLAGHSEELYCCEWVRNSELVLTASGSELMLWDISRQRRVAQLMLQSAAVHSALRSCHDQWTFMHKYQRSSTAYCCCEPGVSRRKNVQDVAYNSGLRPVLILASAVSHQRTCQKEPATQHPMSAYALACNSIRYEESALIKG